MKKSIPLLVAIALLESATPLKASEYRGAQVAIAPIASYDRLPYAAQPTDEAQSNEASEESESVLRHLTLLHPAKSECNPRTTATYFGSGLGIICLGLDTSDAAAGEGEISMLYCEDLDGDYETLASVNVANEGAVNFEGTSMTSSPATTTSDDDGLPTFTPSYYMNILFAGDGTGGIVVEQLQKFTRYGYYRLLIPDGAIMIEGRPTAGGSILFHYTAGGSTAVDFTYSLTPAEGEVFTDVSLLGYGQLGITVEFPKATTISYAGNGGATLTHSDGTTIKGLTPRGSGGRGFIYTFGYASTVWKNGVYTFRLPAGDLAIDMGMLDYGERGNSPEIIALYYVEDSTLGMGVIGISPADAYDVYTLDGRTIMIGGKIEDMRSLPEGVYIVNGSKVRLVNRR